MAWQVDNLPCKTREDDTALRSDSLAVVLHSLKRHTAREANRVLGCSGPFWQHESFDHYGRDEREWARIVAYVLNNPVEAGLVKDWMEWPWSYCRPA